MQRAPEKLVFALVLKSLIEDAQKIITREEIQDRVLEEMDDYKKNPLDYDKEFLLSADANTIEKAKRVTLELYPEFRRLPQAKP